MCTQTVRRRLLEISKPAVSFSLSGSTLLEPNIKKALLKHIYSDSHAGATPQCCFQNLGLFVQLNEK